MMSDSEAQASEQQIENKINKELEKLKYYLEQTDEIIEEQDLREIETVKLNKRTKAIMEQIYSLVSTAQETKVELGKSTSQEIRQWKKEVRDRYTPWVNEMNKHKG
jgi:hypothetical protein